MDVYCQQITFSPLETISTSLWASLHHRFQYCLFSVMSAVSSYLFISSQVLSIHLRLGRPFFSSPVQPCPSPSRPPLSSLPQYNHVHLRLGRPFLLFPGTTMSIIFREMYYYFLLMYPDQFNLFCFQEY